MATPALNLFAICASIIGLHLLALAFWTGTVRAMRKTFVNAEDAKAFKADKSADAEHPDVARVKRAHQNALENAVPFFAIGYLYAMQGPTKDGAIIYFGVFTAARILHSVFYLWGRQPFRTMMFAIGALATIGMGVHVLMHAS